LKEKLHNSVYYYFIKDKKINGTLFYCFEYFEFLNNYRDTYFYIYDISKEDLEFVKNIFKNKYNFNEEILEKIIPINNIREIYNSQGYKNLILDIRTFNKISPFLKNDIYAFVNERGNLFKSKIKKIFYYGSYDYQSYDIYNILKFNFNIFKPFENPKNGKEFISAGNLKNLPKNVDKKKPNEFFNIFKEYEKFKYIHNYLDVNNRFIVECFFYERELEFVNEIKVIDSAVLRYEDCLNGNLEEYKLTKDDKIIQGILNDN